MPENEFEKQVQERMEELRLRPDAAVWENIEAELKGKKRRRALVYIFLFAGLLLLGYGGYYLSSGYNKPAVHEDHARNGTTDAGDHSTSTSSTSNSNSTSNPASPHQQDQDIHSTPSSGYNTVPGRNTPISDSEADMESPVTVTTGNVAKAGNANRKDPTAPVGVTAKTSTKSNTTTVNKKSSVPPVAVSKDAPKHRDVTDEPVASVNNKKRDDVPPASRQTMIDTPAVAFAPPKNADGDGAQGEGTKADSISVKGDTAVAIIETGSITDTTGLASKSPGRKRSIRWAADVSGGFSSHNTTALFGGGLMSQDALTPPLSGAPVPPLTGGLPAPVVIPRSDVKAGPSFRIGILGEMSLSRRSSIASGIQYLYMSNKIKVGSYNPSPNSFNNYASQQVSVIGTYGGPHLQDFTNQYHFIQIPLQYRLQLGRGKSAPVSISAGLSAAYLVSTNALVYSNTQGGFYYHNKEAFNRLHMNLNTGFSLLFGSSKRWQWSIGPEVSFDLTRLAKESYDQKQYLFYGGVGAKIYLPSIKK